MITKTNEIKWTDGKDIVTITKLDENKFKAHVNGMPGRTLTLAQWQRHGTKLIAAGWKRYYA